MSIEYFGYTCPHCGWECNVPASMTGQDLVCPSCSKTYFATPPDPQQLEASPPAEPAQIQNVMPAKVPFLKSGKRKILREGYESLLARYGTFDGPAERELSKLAIVLGLEVEEVLTMNREHFMAEVQPIQRGMESAFLLTDEDLSEIKRLEQKYRIRLKLEGNASLFREIYLLEKTGKLPNPVITDLMLSDDEPAFYCLATTWLQPRVHTVGYSGGSFSLPSGVKGFNFRFGGYTPIRTEEITSLATGNLLVTSERLIFRGDSRNTNVALKKVVDGHVYADCVRIDKTSGKPDFFSMTAPEARYILSLIGVLKQATPRTTRQG